MQDWLHFMPGLQSVGLCGVMLASKAYIGWWAALLTYIIYYFAVAAAPPRLVHTGHFRIKKILEHCPALSQRFFPFMAFHSDVQIITYIIQEKIHAFFSPMHAQEEQPVKLPMGGEALLWWQTPPPPESTGGIVFVILPGVTGIPEDRTARALLEIGAKQGWYAALVLRRGHPAKVDPAGAFSIFGDSRETDACVNAAAERSPGCKVVLVGVSAGSACAVRWLGEHIWHGEYPEGWLRQGKSDPQAGPDVLCCISIAAGFDVTTAPARCHKRFEKVLLAKMKKFFLHGNQRAHLLEQNPEAYKRCQQAGSLVEFLQHHADLAGMDGWDAYARSHNPMEVLRPPSKHFPPTLFLQARDDPISVSGNVEQVLAEGLFGGEKAPFLMVETPRGSHSCWFGLGGGTTYLRRMVADFVGAVQATK
eukprot:Hpha_TRINITY_DN26999_c0_g1::TRINITY_DN26999_c0_g1_i1::g.24884::m.24884/K13697/ABHD2; abhydrolase domain-containing protein 2